MTATSQPCLWDADRTPRPRSVPASCALCGAAPPATPFGLCAACLATAAAEHARLNPGASDYSPRPSAVRYADLCRRCGSSRHSTDGCAA